ncbi:MAG: hypothetical protein WA051_02085 [Minisyncoccia bacterium]
MEDLSDQKLQRILELSESNNKILRAVKRSILLGRIFHTLYWVVIIGVSVGAFYFLKPYISQIEDLYGGLKSGASSAQGINDVSFGTLLKNLGR